MSHRTLAGLIVALVASSVLPPAGAPPPPAPPAVDVEVSLVSVIPGTLSGDGDWCVGAAPEIRLTAHVVDLISQSEVMEGLLEWQVCYSPTRGAFPKEDCDMRNGSARWGGGGSKALFLDSSPTLLTRQMAPVLGWRLVYRPERGSVYEKGAMSQSFNLDRTCLPSP
jgi:hypothetical protein